MVISLLPNRSKRESILENAFCAAALTFAPDEMLQMWEGNFRKSVRRMVDWIKKHAEEDGLDAAALAEAEVVQQALPGGKLLSLKLISELGPLRDSYPAYSVLSDQAAHPTARVLDWHVTREKGRPAYRVAPGSREEIYDAIRGLFAVTLPVIVGVTDFMKLSPHDRAVEALVELGEMILPSRRKPS